MAQSPRKALNDLTATEIVAAVASRSTTCEAVVRACLERIDTRESEVHAWQHLEPEQVLAQARAVDSTGRRGPLLGVPFGAKDIIDTCDMPTEYGSPIHKGNRPRSDAACIALSRRAGGILLGKTVTTEFANRYPGKTRNPLDPTRTPGGSSSGSAAAVGDHHVPLALGTQTSGSTLRPASFCGVFGFRPTHGDVRCTGVKEAAGSLDTVGPLARSIEDIALFRDVLLGIDPQPLPEYGPPRIGFCRTHLWTKLEPYTQQHLETAARQLAAAGAKVRELTLPTYFERIEDAHRWVSSFEFARNFAWEIDNHWEGISLQLRNGRIKDGLSCTYERYIEARTFAESARVAVGEIFADCDVVLTATAVGEATPGLSNTGDASLCTLWTTLHVPALTIPVFKGPNGLPVGAQLIAKRNEDRKLLAAARWIYSRLT
jgi:amidase